jgi:hypothetical protein
MLDNLYTLEQMARRIPEERLREAEQARLIALAQSQPEGACEPVAPQADNRGLIPVRPADDPLAGRLRRRALSVLQMLSR